MMRATALHGVPYFDNGPVDRFIELRSPFNLWSQGHLWGIYGPVFGYYAAPAFLLGGLHFASIATALLLVPIAISTFLLTRRLLDDEWYATIAGILVVISTPVFAKSLEMTGYPLAMLFGVAATAATVDAMASASTRRTKMAVLSGVFFALGSGTHLLCLPMAMASLVMLAVTDATPDAPVTGPAWLARTPFAGLWPTKATLASAGVALGTMVLLTIPLAILNKARFGSYNPFSYGPQPWAGMDYLAAADQTISAHIKSALPTIAVVLVGVVGFIAGGAMPQKQGRIFTLVVMTLLGVAILAVPALAQNVWRYTKAAYAFIVDQSLVELQPPYHRVPGTFANFHGQWVTKSALQCTPLLALGLLLPGLPARTRKLALGTIMPSIALFAYLTLRGNLPLYSGLGVPWVYIRYTLPGLPPLVATAMLVVREVKAGAREAVIGGTVAVIVATILFAENRDAPLFRQVVVLALPIASLAASMALVVAHRRFGSSLRVAAAAVAITAGMGVGIGIGHDFRAHLDQKAYCDHRADAMRSATPPRFAMFGYHPTLDPVLAVTMERDVEYADLAEGDRRIDDFVRMRSLVDYWFETDRPVFYAADDPPKLPSWPDVVFEPVDRRERIFKLTQKR
jgi:hypothetical protein